MGRTVQKAADNVRKLTRVEAPAAPDAPALKTGDAALRKPLAQSPNTTLNNADDGLPIAVVRNLIYSGAPEDLAQLRKIVDGLSDRGKANLMASIARETRDPQVGGIDPKTKKPRPIQLTEEGKMLMDATFNGKDPDPSWIANKPATPGGGTRLDLVSAEADLEPKTFRPEWKSDGRRDLKDDPSFRSTEEVKENKDGEFVVKHKDQHYDGQTKRAIDRAKEGLPVGPIYDDAANTPGQRKPGRALAAGTQTPKQEATKLMHRLAETSNAHGVIDSKRADDPLMYDTADVQQDNPSVFAPGNTGSKMKRHVTTVRPADHSDAMRAFSFVKKGEFANPNQQFNSAEDFARAFVESVDQEGLNVTPVTARERADATEMLQSYNFDDDFPTERSNPGIGNHGMYMPPPGQMTDAAAGRMMRQNMSDTVKATKTAERSLMQEQAVASLARKFEDIFGHQGWGENYKPSTRPGTSEPAAPAGGIGEGVSTTQDPAQVPHLIERGPAMDDSTDMRWRGGDYDAPAEKEIEVHSRNRMGESPTPKVRVAPGKPGMELDPELDGDDLADLHNQRVGGEGPELPNGEQEPVVTTGRAQGDKARVNPSKSKELPGNKPGEYQDKQPFAAYNRENRDVPQSDLDRRRQFAEQWNKTVGGETERSSVLRQQLRELMESNEPEAPGTRSAAAKATQVADLQRRLRLAERLDSMSGVNSMRTNDPDTGMIVTPQPTSVADLQSNSLAASARPLETDEIDLPGSKKFDLDNEPIDAEFEIKQPDAPAKPTPEALPGPAKQADVEPESGWKKAAKRGAVLGAGLVGGLGIYELLRRAGQPPANGGPPVGGDQLGPPPGGSDPNGPGGYPPYFPPGGPAGQDLGAKPEDRIRALQNFRMDINPRTQILQSYVR